MFHTYSSKSDWQIDESSITNAKYLQENDAFRYLFEYSSYMNKIKNYIIHVHRGNLILAYVYWNVHGKQIIILYQPKYNEGCDER